MEKHYTMTIAGLERHLPLCRINEHVSIAALIIFGDVALTQACARELLAMAPAHDIIITAEAKGIPLVYEMAAQSGNNDYIIARKAPKLYMQDVLSVRVNSITTEKPQELFLGHDEVTRLQNRRVLIVDDVISTGNSLGALERLVEQVGGQVVGRMAILAEGEAQTRDDILYLGTLPLFDAEGHVL